MGVTLCFGGCLISETVRDINVGTDDVGFSEMGLGIYRGNGCVKGGCRWVALTGRWRRVRPLAYLSPKLKKTQRNYSATELEAWAVVTTCRKFRKYLEAADRVVVISDHNSLQWIRSQQDPRGKFSRWIMELESLRYQVRFRKGSANGVADYLSLAPRV